MKSKMGEVWHRINSSLSADDRVVFNRWHADLCKYQMRISDGLTLTPSGDEFVCLLTDAVKLREIVADVPWFFD